MPLMPIWERRLTADPSDRRHYKGGDGGAGEMREQEAARQAKVQAGVDAINTKFGQGRMKVDEQAYLAANPDVAAAMGPGGFSSGQQHFDMYGEQENRRIRGGVSEDPANAQAKASREAQYAGVGNAVRDVALRDLDRQFTQASQQNTFGLANSGLLGGSVDAEAGGDLATRYGEGRMKAEQAGIGAAADLRNTDEKTRQSLISLAQSGLDTGTASTMAAGQMAAATDLARSQAQGANVGRLFDDMGQAYLASKVGAARQQAQAPATSGYGTAVFSPSRYTGKSQA